MLNRLILSHAGATMAAEIRVFPCLSDNIGYLVHDPETKATAAIDAPEAKPIIAALESEGWRLTDLLITHHHADHTDGIAELKAKYRSRVVGPFEKRVHIEGLDIHVKEGDIVKVGNLTARVFETPGLSLDHISYMFDADHALFCADSFFSIGCGRVIDGYFPILGDSLLKLLALPNDTLVY